MAGVICPWCSPTVVMHRHCGKEHPTCTWLRCRGCSAVVDPQSRRANRDGVRLTWPSQA